MQKRDISNNVIPSELPSGSQFRVGDESHPDCETETGFTLIEVACALVIILIALLGVVFAFSYSISYNAGNNARAQALAVLQQEVEQIRSAKFTKAVTDPTLTGGIKSARTVTTPTGLSFTVQIIIDNDPLASGIQDDSSISSPTLKEITVLTQLAAPSPGWQTAIPAVIILRRVRAN